MTTLWTIGLGVCCLLLGLLAVSILRWVLRTLFNL